MTIDTQTVIMTVKGEPYKDGMEDTAPDLVLGTVIGNVFVIHKTNDPWKQYKLTNQFSKAEGKTEVTAEDVVFIKKALEDNAKGDRSAYNPYIMGQCIDLLETTKTEAKAAPKK